MAESKINPRAYKQDEITLDVGETTAWISVMDGAKGSLNMTRLGIEEFDELLAPFGYGRLPEPPAPPEPTWAEKVDAAGTGAVIRFNGKIESEYVKLSDGRWAASYWNDFVSAESFKAYDPALYTIISEGVQE